MLLIFNSPIKNSIITYLIIAISLLIYKPRGVFDEYGNIIEFGLDQGKTLLSYPTILFISAIFITFFYEYLHIKKYRL